jgi:hypothetical protein
MHRLRSTIRLRDQRADDDAAGPLLEMSAEEEAMTNWREFGDTDQTSFLAAIKGTPLEAEGPAIYSALKPNTRLGYAQMRVESGLGESELAASADNMLGQRPRPDDNGPTVPGPFRKFNSFAECAAYYSGKITDPNYAYANTVTLEQFIHVYAPSSDGNNEAEYVANVERYVALLPKIGDTPVPDPVTFGNVPHPDYIDDIVSSSENHAWDDLGARTIRGIVWHRMLGSLLGTAQFFHGGAAALTDYGVGVTAQDGANLDGVLYRWNDPKGRRAPWANGALSNPYGDGLAFYNLYGVNAINRDLTAIEISGFQTTAVSPKARQRVAELTAYWADQYKVSWETFPLIPGEGNRSFVIWHQEITIGTGKLCPFDEVMNQTPSLIEQTRGVLKQYQTSTIPDPPPPPPPPEYASPLDLPWFDADLEKGYPSDHVWDSKKWGKVQVYAALRPYESLRAANRLQGPDTKAEKVGPRLKVKESFRGPYTMKVDGRVFVLTYGRSFVDAGTLTPRVSVVPR